MIYIYNIFKSRKTDLIELNTEGYSGELQYKPGDHIGIFAQNRIELVDAILAKVTNAPPSDKLIKVEVLREKPTVFGLSQTSLILDLLLFSQDFFNTLRIFSKIKNKGVSKQWVVDERYPPCSLRMAFTCFLDITSTLSQNMIMYLSTQATNETDRLKLEKLAKVIKKKKKNN